MSIEISDMVPDRVSEYAALYADVFNAEPWNDSWTVGAAAERISLMMNTPTFTGKALYSDNIPKGFIMGQRERYYDGMHFQIQEFCVLRQDQGKGYGKALLNALERELKGSGIVNIYLLTSKGEKTEGYYRKRGFATTEGMILMKKRLSD